VDDPNHPLCIERRVREVIEIIWSGQEGGPTAEAIEHEACEILGVKSLRDYFRKPAGFFADHLKRYSKSRRQAPIYWPLSTASGSYTLWIYYHRLTPDTLYKCLQQFLEPKIKDVEQEIHRLRTMLTADEAGTKERKQLADAETLLNELKELHAELSLWAPKWKPNLNDGVLITACPLWKLFRLPKWRKDLEACWKELEAGDYDWSHLAYTLFPARAREKCKTDRSIAIAHGLEDLCQVQAPVPKKKTSKSRRNMRRSHHALGKVNVIIDPVTGEYKLPHHINLDGTYNNRQVVIANKNNAIDETAAETL
jgi:ribosomal protein L32